VLTKYLYENHEDYSTLQTTALVGKYCGRVKDVLENIRNPASTFGLLSCLMSERFPDLRSLDGYCIQEQNLLWNCISEFWISLCCAIVTEKGAECR